MYFNTKNYLKSTRKYTLICFMPVEMRNEDRMGFDQRSTFLKVPEHTLSIRSTPAPFSISFSCPRILQRYMYWRDNVHLSAM
jgi:hypothetical protein